MNGIEKLQKLLHDHGWAVFIEGNGYFEGNKWWKIKAVPLGTLFPRIVEKRGEKLEQVIQEVFEEITKDDGDEENGDAKDQTDHR